MVINSKEVLFCFVLFCSVLRMSTLSIDKDKEVCVQEQEVKKSESLCQIH